jgi:Uma2 family endonuclease
MSTATQLPTLTTAAEFLRRHGDESGIELVNGQIVRLPMPGAEHGEVCATATILIGNAVRKSKIGRILSNDTFIRTSSNPDSFRGADLCFISYERLPADQPTPTGPIDAPDLVVEVRSPSNSIAEMTDKASEYLRAGVRVVIVLDPPTASAGVFRADELPLRFSNGDELTLPDVLPGFSVRVAEFFE